MNIWISRENGCYNIHDKEPQEKNYSMSQLHGPLFKSYVAAECAPEFERLTGIVLEPGQFCQIEVKQIGDVYYFEDEK